MEFVGIDEVKDRRLWRALSAELVGTFIVVLIGTATMHIVSSELYDIARIIRISFAFGFTTASALKAFIHVSGGHINPAVTVSFLISGEIRLIKGLLYIIIQFVGAILASLLLKFMTRNVEGNPVIKYSMGQNVLKVSPVNGLIMEMLLTFMVVLLIHGLHDPGRIYNIKGSTPLAIGLGVIAAHMTGLTWTGCGINPARTLGPAIIASYYNNIWVFFAGPFIGAILAGFTYRFVMKAPEEE